MTSRPYTDPAHLFTLDLPAEWLLERPEQGPIRMACLAPERGQGFTANVNAGVHPLAPLTTDEYVMLCRLQLRQLSGLRELPVAGRTLFTTPSTRCFVREWDSRVVRQQTAYKFRVAE